MSEKELKRVSVIEAAVGKKLKQKEAAKALNLKVRQVRRLMTAYRLQGAEGLISKRRGQKSNRQYPTDYKAQIEALVRAEYADFGPQLASEKLYERQGLVINRETLRQWMLEWGLRKAKRAHPIVLHPHRERRGRYGELVQIDGSPHDWFEGRRDKCCLLVFIDDATSKLLALRFEEAETSAGYFRVLKGYLKAHGLPWSFYSDRYGVFRVNQRKVKSAGETQFGRACRELGIELICANSAPAKGRVERVNRTLQDRLVKELRLRGISDLETANAFLPSYVIDHNRHFEVAPREASDAHRAVSFDESSLQQILSFHYERTLSKNLEFSFKKVIYQIRTQTRGYRLRHSKVKVCVGLEGEVTVWRKGVNLAYTRHEKQTRIAPVVGSKALSQKLDAIIKANLPSTSTRRKPSADHPWRQPFKQQRMEVSFGKELSKTVLPPPSLTGALPV